MAVSESLVGLASDLGSAAGLRAVHGLFVAGELDPSYLASAPIRSVVVESWRRSLATELIPTLRRRRTRRRRPVSVTCAMRTPLLRPCPSADGFSSRRPWTRASWWP